MKTRENVIVSACLMGFRCRYDGNSNALEGLEALLKSANVYPFCPEIYGGLPTPRPSAEISDGRVITKAGADVTEMYEKGARELVEFATTIGCRFALMKARSPSCGSGRVYDGTFSKTLVPGDGIAAGKMKEAGVKVFDETQLDELLSALRDA